MENKRGITEDRKCSCLSNCHCFFPLKYESLLFEENNCNSFTINSGHSRKLKNRKKSQQLLHRSLSYLASRGAFPLFSKTRESCARIRISRGEWERIASGHRWWNARARITTYMHTFPVDRRPYRV